MQRVSRPEPDPQYSGQAVTPILVARLKELRCDTALIELIEARDAFGRQKYGQPLMSNDGRDGVEDAKQELGDLLQYCQKCVMAKQDTGELKALLVASLPILSELLGVRFIVA